MSELINPNADIYAVDSRCVTRSAEEIANEMNPDVRDAIDNIEVFNIIRNIRDPEYPNSLEELRVLTLESVTVIDGLVHAHQDVSPNPRLGQRRCPRSIAKVQFTPTVPHCSMSTLIGLCIIQKLRRSLPARFKIKVGVVPGTHEQDVVLNKQLDDKERVAAALENSNITSAVEMCIADD